MLVTCIISFHTEFDIITKFDSNIQDKMLLGKYPIKDDFFHYTYINPYP
jgi:hypothetical protein